MRVAKLLPALAVAVVAGAALATATTSLQQDFTAYRVAGAAQRAGLDPYLNHLGSTEAPGLWDGVALFRHSRFLYPPLVADLFRPLAALRYLTAKLLFTLAMLGAWVGAALVVGGPRDRGVVLVAGALFFPLYRHFERGQIDLLLLLLLAVAWRWRTRPLLAGLALAAAIAVKPALAGVALVVAALGRVRLVAVALAGLVAIVGLTAVVDGPHRLREYALEVLPRAGLFGEGGTEEMLLPSARLPGGEDDGTTVMDGRVYRTGLWNLPAAASLPRLLAPETPSRLSSLLPFIVLCGLLVGAARRCAASGSDGEWLFWAAAVASVIASPAGWVMGLVFALPLAPRLLTAIGGRRWTAARAIAAGVCWVGVALPSPVSGLAAIAATGLVLVAAAETSR
ncbi:MAG TPA: glycosyltransferase family 87 protein [Polyangia bacterium]|nr:glycosyltransferase family 87 protein [Polyangia bacterium]